MPSILRTINICNLRTRGDIKLMVRHNKAMPSFAKLFAVLMIASPQT